MRSAVRAARVFVGAPAWADYVISEFGAFANATTDAELDAYIRDNADTVDHPIGTVPMGKGPEGALNADLTVKGTVGLRVVDASAFVSLVLVLRVRGSSRTADEDDLVTPSLSSPQATRKVRHTSWPSGPRHSLKPPSAAAIEVAD